MDNAASITHPVMATASIPTGHASRYLQQLCKHFAHKRPVTFDTLSGQISFAIGECRLAAHPAALRIVLGAEDREQMAELQDVVVRHLVRFAFREELSVEWTDVPDRPAAASATEALRVGEHALDPEVTAVLDTYHAMQREERQTPRTEPPGGRDGGQDMRMRAIGPDTGRFLNTLARSLDAPLILELGTSFGYSAIWLADAARSAGGRLVTMEYHDYKSAFARQKSAEAGLEGHVEFVVGDATKLIGALGSKVDFVFFDLWKDLYLPCLEAVYPLLNPGAILVADNMLRPGGEDIRRYQQALRAKPGITSVLLPIGSGLEVSRFEP